MRPCIKRPIYHPRKRCQKCLLHESSKLIFVNVSQEVLPEVTPLMFLKLIYPVKTLAANLADIKRLEHL